MTSTSRYRSSEGVPRFPPMSPYATDVGKGTGAKRSDAQPRIVQGLEKLEQKGTLGEMRRTFEEARTPSRCSVPYETMERALHHITVKLDDLLSLQECIHRPEEKSAIIR